MKKIGLIGGMSWESSKIYYEILNQTVKQKLGGHSSCRCLLSSVDFSLVLKLQHEGKWDDELSDLMIEEARILEKAGADILMICANTMHLTADKVQKNINIPLLHIVDTTGQKIKEKGLKKLGLLGTIYTMEKDFYKKRLFDNYGIETIVPEKEERIIIDDIINNELDQGIIKDESRDKYKSIIKKLEAKGAQGIILGCTEIPLLISQSDCSLPIFDTVIIHAEKAVEMALTVN